MALKACVGGAALVTVMVKQHTTHLTQWQFWLDSRNATEGSSPAHHPIFVSPKICKFYPKADRNVPPGKAAGCRSRFTWPSSQTNVQGFVWVLCCLDPVTSQQNLQYFLKKKYEHTRQSVIQSPLQNGTNLSYFLLETNSKKSLSCPRPLPVRASGAKLLKLHL